MLPLTKIKSFPNETGCPPKKNNHSHSTSTGEDPQTTISEARAWALSSDTVVNKLAGGTSEGLPVIKDGIFVLALSKKLVCISATHQKLSENSTKEIHFEDNCQYIPITLICESTP